MKIQAKSKAEKKCMDDHEKLNEEIINMYDLLKEPILANNLDYSGQLMAGILVRMGGIKQIYSVLNNDNWESS